MATMDLSSPSEPLLFDEVRRIFLRATPEEKVRQALLYEMIHRLGFPKEFLVVEKQIKELPHLGQGKFPERRVDILSFAKGIHPQHALYPLLLVECKEGEADVSAEEQVIGYNHFVGAYFVAIADASSVRTGYWDRKEKSYLFRRGLPNYEELLHWIRLS